MINSSHCRLLYHKDIHVHVYVPWYHMFKPIIMCSLKACACLAMFGTMIDFPNLFDDAPRQTRISYSKKSIGRMVLSSRTDILSRHVTGHKWLSLLMRHERVSLLCPTMYSVGFQLIQVYWKFWVDVWMFDDWVIDGLMWAQWEMHMIKLVINDPHGTMSSVWWANAIHLFFN